MCVISTDDARQRALNSGAWSFVGKPIQTRDTIDQMLDCLKEFINHAPKRVLLLDQAPERVKAALEMVRKDPAKVGHTEWTFAKEIVLLDALLKKSPAVDVEVQAVQVGPAVFLTTPAEYFCRFGLQQKAKSGFPFTFPVSLANGCVGYVPTEDAFGPSGGGYETRLTSYSNLEITAGTRMMRPNVMRFGILKPRPGSRAPLALLLVGCGGVPQTARETTSRLRGAALLHP